mmetsp:Transcript_27440/g.58273  ORF Transcript_27440/g.58273 Transcript_27440/m.58273 type:complete len:386 (+) Transcript_27440:360-1517(+)|eukprot:CAMPEP_0172532414 /NCGR_PEP_ID=MMETSP1067-20121228/5479_1 /TAXON_ID=265564 ORGANISM="Thalassiosira punctigera, Strain Tpunct2005C2" /NCGR_SAMPLE_ID=MMETSP1067 /ASSEMBLY_ACC=CAM_ASM_000444 /LENGTH=385 /DNA_ID=CAMNT_0013316927 /DNA_START=354 /DNA_END=1511 /DNA_ORIENTATION=-
MMKPSANNSTAPRYDLGLNPPYQINFRAKRAGKRITATKRRITFQFGFSSASAIASGRVEKECRGEEHEIVLVWSHISGKRQLYLDGREVHSSRAARGNTRFEYSWNAFGCHAVKVVANASPPNGYGASAGQERQFDMELDGMSFFKFSQIYELGRSGSASERAGLAPGMAYSYRGLAYRDSRDDDEDEEEPPMSEVSTAVDLFDAPSPSSQFSSLPSLVGSSSNSSSCGDEFLPVEYNQHPTPKTYDSVSNEILCAYNAKAPDAPPSAPSSSRALVPLSEEGVDQISKSMRSLVNLDDITTSTVQPIAPDSPSLNTLKRGGANWNLVGRAPTLSEMRDATVPERARSSGGSFYQPQPQAHAAERRASAPAHYYGATNMGHGPAY